MASRRSERLSETSEGNYDRTKDVPATVIFIEPERVTMSLARSAANGVLFTMGAQVSKIVLQFVSVAVLARLLTPHDYGLIALVLVVVGAGEVFRDFGLTAATLQALTVTAQQRSQLFWLNALIGMTIGLVVFALSWPISWVADQTQLLTVIQVLSLLFVINGLMTQHRAQLQRQMRFKAIAVIDIIAAIIGLGAAIAAALAGAGYWALVLQQLIVAAISMLMSFILGRWIPSRPTRANDIGDFISFGWNLVATNMIVYAANQVDTVLVNAKFGTSALGLYNRAFQLVMTPLNQIRGPLSSVAQPVFARVQMDQTRFWKYITSGQLALGYTIGMPLALVVVLAEPLVRLMLGDRWLSAIPILQCFATAAFFSNLAMIGYWVYVSRGLVAHLFRYTLVSLGIKVTCILIGAQFGLVGVAVGFAASPVLAWPLSLWWLSRVTPIPVRRLYFGALRVVVLGAIGAVGAWGTTSLFPGLDAIYALLLGTAAAVIMMAAALYLPWFRQDAAQLLWFARLMLNKTTPADTDSVREDPR